MAISVQTARIRTRFDAEMPFAWQENRVRQKACQWKPRHRDQVFDFAVRKLINLRDGPNPQSLIQFAQKRTDFHRFMCSHSQYADHPRLLYGDQWHDVAE